MGNELFGVDIAGIVADNIGPGLLDVTIIRTAEGDRQAGNLTGGRESTPATFTGTKGIWEDLPRTAPPGIEFQLNDRVALLIGDTIPAGGIPIRNDAIEIEGIRLWVVQLLGRDPAAATYRYLCRDRAGEDGV